MSSESSRTRRALRDLTAPSGWIDHTGATTVATRHQVGQFNRDGYFTLERAFHPDTVAELTAALAFEVDLRDTASTPTLDEPPADVLSRFCGHPLLAGIARDFVGPDALVAADHAVVGRFGEETATFVQAPHAGRGGPAITCWVVLTESAPGHGPLQVVRGFHRRGRPEPDAGTPSLTGPLDDHQVIDVETDAGSVVVMSSLTPRRLGPNLTGHPAVAYAIHYATDASTNDDTGSASRRFAVVRGGQLVSPI